MMGEKDTRLNLIISQQILIEFTVTLHNAVARKRYQSKQSNAFTVDKDGCQTD